MSGDAQGSGATAPNVGGDEEHPFDFPKQAIPTVSDLGWVTASDVGILFNATDPSGDGLNLVDLTLKFYNSTGGLLGAIDGSFDFGATDVGTGGAGQLFTVSPDELAYVQGILDGGGTIYTALESTITGVHGGGESFTIVNVNGTAVPEPATWAMMLLGFGGIGFAMRRGRKQNGRLLQVA